jgi:DNA-binding MarR family transcriptional regulator
MTSLLNTLEGRGLIERHPHPDDRRKILVYLTKEAGDTVDQMLPVIHSVIAAALSDLSEAERGRLIRPLSAIWTRLGEISKLPMPNPKRRRSRRSMAF